AGWVSDGSSDVGSSDLTALLVACNSQAIEVPTQSPQQQATAPAATQPTAAAQPTVAAGATSAPTAAAAAATPQPTAPPEPAFAKIGRASCRERGEVHGG